LADLLFEAAGSPTGRRRKTFRRTLGKRSVTVARLIADFSPLEQLEAFRSFQRTLEERYPFAT